MLLRSWICLLQDHSLSKCIPRKQYNSRLGTLSWPQTQLPEMFPILEKVYNSTLLNLSFKTPAPTIIINYVCHTLQGWTSLCITPTTSSARKKTGHIIIHNLITSCWLFSSSHKPSTQIKNTVGDTVHGLGHVTTQIKGEKSEAIRSKKLQFL